MSAPMNGNPLLNSCAEVAPLLVFYACDEVEQYEREQIDAHLAICDACCSLLGEESELQTAFSTVSQPADEMDPAGALLAQCRSELSEKLDDLEMPKAREHWMPFRWVQRWMALRPAWSAAGLILFGVRSAHRVRESGNLKSTANALRRTDPRVWFREAALQRRLTSCRLRSPTASGSSRSRPVSPFPRDPRPSPTM